MISDINVKIKRGITENKRRKETVLMVHILIESRQVRTSEVTIFR